MQKLQQIQGAIYGLLVGDAIGTPYEFTSAQNLPDYALINMTPPEGFRRSHSTIPVGTWSDDGAHALALLTSLLTRGKVDQQDLMNRLIAWYQQGTLALDKNPFDIGVQTQQALERYLDGVPLSRVAESHEYANGNGSLMRVLPLALWHTGTDQELIQDAFDQSHITHAHLRAKVCCAIYCLWARAILQGRNIEEGWAYAVQVFRELYEEGSPERDQLEYHVKPDHIIKGRGTGYVIDCLQSARFALQQSNYQDVIRTAISLGEDTDTTACVAGGIAGLYYGVQQIPEIWLQQLRGKEMVEPLIHKLMVHLA